MKMKVLKKIYNLYQKKLRKLGEKTDIVTEYGTSSKVYSVNNHIYFYANVKKRYYL